MDLPVTSAPAVLSAAPSELLWIAGSEHTQKVPLVLLQWSTWRSVQHFVCWLGRVPENKVYNSFVEEMYAEFNAVKCCSPNWLMEQQSSSSGTHHEPVVHVYFAKTDSHCIDIFLIYPWFEQLDCKSCRNTCAVRIVLSLVKFTGNHTAWVQGTSFVRVCSEQQLCFQATPAQSAAPLPAQGHCSLQHTGLFSYHSASQSLLCTELFLLQFRKQPKDTTHLLYPERSLFKIQ